MIPIRWKLLLVAVVAMAWHGMAFAGNPPAITLGSDSVAPGETASISIDFDEGGYFITEVNFEIPTSPLYSSIDTSNCTGSPSLGTTVTCSVSPGQIDVNIFNFDGLGSQPIGSINFVAAGSATPQSDILTITNAVFLDNKSQSVAGITNNGQITITPAPEIHAGQAVGLAGDTVNIPISFVAGGAIGIVYAELQFSPGLYSNVDLSNCVATASAQFANCEFSNSDPASGIIMIDVGTKPGAMATQTFGTIAFTIIPDALPQTDPLVFGNAAFYGSHGNAQGIVDDGEIVVVADSDGDGVFDNIDNCPSAPNPMQTDSDDDGIGDTCDSDVDGDGIANGSDNCPSTANTNQADADSDGIGNVCDALTDSDDDGVADAADNCPSTPNTEQTDTDADGVGDVCDLIGALPVLSLCEDGAVPTVEFAAGPSTGSQTAILGGALNSLQISDFNADGFPEFAATHGVDEDAGAVALWRRDGAGQYRSALSVEVGPRPGSLTAGDFNGDGLQDLVVADQGSADVSVLLNDGTGDFIVAQRIPLGGSPQALATLDMDADGDLDLALSGIKVGSVALLANQGGGYFVEQTSYAVGDSPLSIATGDFDDDGLADIAILDRDVGELLMLHNINGSGFALELNVAKFSAPRAVVAGDFDGDGDRGLAVIDSSQAITWLDNTNWSGAINRHQLPTEFVPQALLAADLNGDGLTDLAASGDSSAIVLWLASKAGGFDAPQPFYAGSFSRGLYAVDMDADQRMDLISLHAREAVVSVFTNRGGGRFADDQAADGASLAGLTPAGLWSPAIVAGVSVTCESANPRRVVADDPNTPDNEGPACSETSPGTFQLDFSLIPDAYSVQSEPLVALTAADTATDQIGGAILRGLIAPVNDAPSFVVGATVATAANAGPVVRDAWATAISPGAANEAGQTLHFSLTPDDASMFTPDGQPSIDPATGQLSYILADGVARVTAISAVLLDDGPGPGSSNGTCAANQNQSAAAHFFIAAYAGPTELDFTGTALAGDGESEAGGARVSVNNAGDLGAVDVVVSVVPPSGVQILDAYNVAQGCEVVLQDDGSSALQCDDADGDGFQCDVADNVLTCTLSSLPAAAQTELLIQTSEGAGNLQVTTSAANADQVTKPVPFGG